jgi:hypothetical protein
LPDVGLLVSPDHQIVLRGARARTLYNADEVLVTARDLIKDHSIIRNHAQREVPYIDNMLLSHEIVFANSVATESFHPASNELSVMEDTSRDRMFDRLTDFRLRLQLRRLCAVGGVRQRSGDLAARLIFALNWAATGFPRRKPVAQMRAGKPHVVQRGDR